MNVAGKNDLARRQRIFQDERYLEDGQKWLWYLFWNALILRFADDLRTVKRRTVIGFALVFEVVLSEHRR